MESIVSILMRRDGMSKKEAKDLVAETRSMMLDEIDLGNYMEAEEIFMSELGLEPDYMMELFF